MLFFLPEKVPSPKAAPPEFPEELFSQVIQASLPQINKIWEDGDALLLNHDLKCPEEILPSNKVGSSYYKCQPHFWQCYWQGGVLKNPKIKVELYGRTFHVNAVSVFNPIESYSKRNRFYEIQKILTRGLKLKYGVKIELRVEELPEFSQPLLLTDVCRDVFLPERVYAYGKQDKKENFIWDNVGRKIFIDKFYVSHQQVNEWRWLIGQKDKIILSRDEWYRPALLNHKEQISYCAFWGKRVLEAKLLDAASMTPVNREEAFSTRVLRPQTPWQRDLSKTFLGMAKINPDFQLTPLDCQLAQVYGCEESFFGTDSVTWMGLNYTLGFYPEALINPISPELNLKISSNKLPANSDWHELGLRSNWEGEQTSQLPVAFRCYEEVVP